MGRTTHYQHKKFTNHKHRMHNLAPNNNNENYLTTNNQKFWWETLADLCNSYRVHAYSPGWKRPCSKCGSQLLPSEPKNFCCNDILRHIILPLRPLPLILQDLYISNSNNFSHLSRQYNSLFSFTILGYTGGVVHLPHPHVFAINGHAYHQVQHADTKGYPVNWFVYDANTRNCIANQRGLDQEIVNLIEQELAAINPFVQGLYQLYNMDYPQARLVIQQSTNNAEIAACTIIHSTAIVQERCVQIWRVGQKSLEYINILNKNYEALQYPIFFSHGEIGWHIYWIDPEYSNSQKISQVDYYHYRIMTEPRFHLLGRLFNEYLVDMFSRAEDERLQFIRREQHRYRKGGLEEDEILCDEAELCPNNIYLPASHTLSYRWSYKKTMNALTIVSKLGQPTLFITFITNPNWPEIQQQLRTGQNYADRPDIVVRVFKQRLTYLHKLLKKYFGKIIYYMHAIEFQKCGLPHAHIIIKSAPNLLQPKNIDKVICAELPVGNDPHQSHLRDLVKQYMIHQCTSRCLQNNGHCHWNYPKPIQEHTIINEHGHVYYKRHTVNDANIVPYSPFLLLKLHSHINVEVASTSYVISYLYKYIYKGPDRTSIAIEIEEKSRPKCEINDEIKDYLNAHYLSAMEATWRIFKYEITAQSPSVICLPIHLPDDQIIL